MADTRVVVVGAGVSGLTCALLLSKHARYKVTVVAKHMPGDYDIEYASPWAGANYLPVSAPNTSAAEHDRHTWPEFQRLAAEHPEAGIHFQEARNFRLASSTGPIASWQHEPQKPDAWFRDVVPNFRTLEPSELRGYDSGTSFQSVCINPPIYLPWLVSQCLAAGVVFKRGELQHIGDAARMFSAPHTHPDDARPQAQADVVVNCTGLAASTLGGVADAAVYPARGQVVLVRNAAPWMAATSGTGDGEEECCYIMQRAAGGGTILGGSYQPHAFDRDPDPNLAVRIMRRCVALCPELVGAPFVPFAPPASSLSPPSRGESSGSALPLIPDISKLSIIRHGVGLRPCREGGVRIEREKLGSGAEGEGEEKGRGVWVVHNYGHGGYGYQSSYGCAREVERLVGECAVEGRGVGGG